MPPFLVVSVVYSDLSSVFSFLGRGKVIPTGIAFLPFVGMGLIQNAIFEIYILDFSRMFWKTFRRL